MHRRASHRLILSTIIALVVSRTVCVSAQERQDGNLGDRQAAPPVVQIAKGVLLDPTTYIPAALLFTSMRLDWTSSQPLFQHGFVEGNARYTTSGLAHDAPVTYGVGNERIQADALAALGTTLFHNTTNRTIERILVSRFPNHQKILRTIGWVERSAFASYLSYQLSARHFRQWQANERLAGQLGY